MLSTSQQLKLAHAVSARRRARLLAKDNSASPPIALREAVTSGQSYFVVPRPELLVVDADLPDDPKLTADRMASFDLLIEAADRCGVPHVVAASGRPGHRHAYLLVGSGRVRPLIEQWCRERGLDVRARGVRPPGAPHRDGRHVAVLLSPADPDMAVSVLTGQLDGDAASRLAHRLMPVELPARVRSALRHGHTAAGYESPSHGRMALAVAVRSRSGPRSLLELLLSDRSSPLGQTYRARPGRWQQQELRRIWDKAGSWLDSRPAVGPVVLDVNRWAAALGQDIWGGMSGGTDLAVAEAFAGVAGRAGTTAVGFAQADIAVAAGIGVDTARVSVRRLIAAGWLRVIAEATPRTSRVYRLTIPARLRSALPSTALPHAGSDREVGRGVRGGDLGADLARWGALGKATMRMARLLTPGEGMLVEQIAALLRMRHAAVRYHLRKLSRYGLASEVCGRWSSTVSEERVTELEHDLRVAGRRDRQRAQLVELRARRAALLHQYREAWASRRSRTLARAPIQVPRIA